MPHKYTHIDFLRAALKHYLLSKKHYSQDKLAQDTGLTQQTISNLARGESKGWQVTWMKIIKAFEIDYDKFLQKGKEILEKQDGGTITNMTDANIDDPRIDQAMEDLKAIFKSKDPGLIEAITCNLREFRKSAEKSSRNDSPLGEEKAAHATRGPQAKKIAK